MNLQTTLYKCPADNYGVSCSYRDIFMCYFGVPHEWYYKDYESNQWVNGISNDLNTQIILKGLDVAVADYQKTKTTLKQTVQCFTPSAKYECKKKGYEILTNKNPLLQVDFDNLNELDLEEIKAAIYELPFVCYVGKSISGKGLFCLILIEEPEKLEAYAEHLFKVFDYYNLPPDTTKGRKYSDLRFVSYDANFLYRDFPKPLRIKRFNTPKVVAKPKVTTNTTKDSSKLITWAIKEIQSAQIGNRFDTVRRVSFTMGGHGLGFDQIKQAINNSNQFTGVESKYLQHAQDGYEAGKLKPIGQ